MTPKVFNAAAQASPVAATESDSKAICSSLKAKSFGFSVPDQRAFHSPVTRARRRRTRKIAVASASVLSSTSPLRHAASLMPFRRAACRLPPPTQDRSRG
jgi:hypothetical protein